MARQHRQNINYAAGIRASVLGELHEGQMVLEEKHPIIRQLVKISFVANVASAFMLIVLFKGVNFFNTSEKAFMWALMWFFIFGCIYGMFALLTFLYATYAERREVERVLTPNRRYKWHTRYDTHNITDKDMKERPKAGRDTDRPPPPPAPAGSRYFQHTVLLVLCSIISCLSGIVAFLHAVF